jgi:cytochrome c-type biogenesis protein CcmH/NrfG
MAAVSPAADGTDANAAAPDPLAAAKEAFKRGQSRLRVENLEEAIVDLSRAVELAPNEIDYAATLAWARFCNAKDKQALAPVTREELGRAIRKSPHPEVARFYLGRVERMLGRDKEALRHFQEVLEAQPRHADAAAEVRAIEARMAQAAAKESGVFGRKR